MIKEFEFKTRIHKGLKFDGVDDLVEIPVLPVFDSHGFSIIAWLKVDKAGDNAVLICGDSGTKGKYLQCVLYNYSIVFDFYDDKLQVNNVIREKTTYCVAFVWEGPYTKKRFIFLNGELVGADVSTSVLRVKNGSLTNGKALIGKSLAGIYFKGEIYSVMIYDRALAENEIKYIYNNLDPIDPNSLVLWLAPASIDIANSKWWDMSGKRNDGIIYGATEVNLVKPEVAVL